MTSGQKSAVSLLISVLIFAAFAVAAFAGLFSVIETHFYQNAVISGIEKQLNTISTSLTEYSNDQASKFSLFAELSSVKNSTLPSQTDFDIKTRTDSAGKLLSETSGLLGIRVIDSNGRKIHYSTFSSDILRQKTTLLNYTNYNLLTELNYDDIACSENEKVRIIFDGTQDRIIYSFPFYDSYDLYRGSVVFYEAASDFNRYLVAKNIITISDRSKLVATVFTDSMRASRGFIFGLPAISSDLIVDEITKLWEQGTYTTQSILQSDDYDWLVISDASSEIGIVSLVFKSDILVFSQGVKILLLVCVFITLYLVVLLILNIKQDDLTVIRSRIKKFQFSLVNEYLSTQEKINWEQVLQNLSYRKSEVNKDIKKSLGHRGKKNEELVNSLLDKSWTEIQNTISKKIPAKETQSIGINTQEIRKMLEEILSTTRVNAVLASDTVSDVKNKTAKPKPVAKVPSDDVEDLEEVEELDEVEDLEEVGATDAVEELDEVEDLEELDEVEDLEEVGDADAVEELDEVEDLEEVGDADEVEELDEVEDLEEVGDAEEVEELDEVEELEELGEVDPVEEDNHLEEKDKKDIENILSQDAFENLKNEIEAEIKPNRQIYNPELFEEFPDFGDIRPSVPLEENVPAEKTDDSEQPTLDFDICTPDFSALDESESTIPEQFIDKEVPLVSEIEEEKDDEVESLVSVENIDTFSFTQNFSGFKNPEILQSPDEPSEVAIVEDDEGLFTIPSKIKTDDVEIDDEFKNLVDSVLTK